MTEPAEPSTNAGACSDRLWHAGLLCIFLLYVLRRLSLLQIPLVNDEGFFGVGAQALLRGAKLYRDIFDHKPPGIFYIYVLALQIVPASAVGIHLFLHAWNAATLVMVILIGTQLGGRMGGLWCGWLYAAYSCGAAIEGHTACTEIFLLLPVAASFHLALCGWSASHSDGKNAATFWALSGLCGAAACWIKPPAALLLLVIPVFLIANCGAKGISRAVRMYAYWLAGGVAVSVLICLPFIPVWGEFMRWSFIQSSEYFGTMWKDWQHFLAEQMSVWLKDWAFLLITCVVGLVCGIRKKLPLAWAGTALFVFSLLSAVQSGHFFGHYFAMTMLGTALIGGVSLASFAQSQSRRGAVWLPALAALAILPLAWAKPNFTFFPLWNYQTYAAEFIREHSTLNDPVFVFGQEPQIMFLAERKSANPFIDLIPMMKNIARHREFQHLAWERIETEKPLYMVMTYQPSDWMHAPGVDQFFWNQSAQLQREHYRFEAMLIYDRTQKKLRFVATPEEAPVNSPDYARLLEFWRRHDEPKPK